MKNPRIIAVIPARGGSKGIINKNTKLLGLKPLIEYSIDFALESKSFDDIIVSTDIASVYNKYKYDDKIITNGLRPANLSDDTASTSDVIRYELDFCQNLRDEDICVLLQPTCPLRRQIWLDVALEKLMSDNFYSSAISMVSVDGNHPYRMYKIDKNSAQYFINQAQNDPLKPRQLLEPLYIRSGHIYAFPVKTLYTHNNIIGTNIFPIKIPLMDAVNIDSIADWHTAESLLNKF